MNDTLAYTLPLKSITDASSTISPAIDPFSIQHAMIHLTRVQIDSYSHPALDAKRDRPVLNHTSASSTYDVYVQCADSIRDRLHIS